MHNLYTKFIIVLWNVLVALNVMSARDLVTWRGRFVKSREVFSIRICVVEMSYLREAC